MDELSFKKLRWACRRGMLELDVLLGNFLEKAFLSLPPEEQADFIRLLSFNDQELFLWLTGKESTEDVAIARMVEKIRQHAQSNPLS